MSDVQATRQPTGIAKAKPLWRPMDSLRASMVKQVFAKEHFTHKKGLLFTPTVHAQEHTDDIAQSSEMDADVNTSDEVESDSLAAHENPSDSGVEAPDIEAIRSQAFAQGLAQGLEQAQQQALQNQAATEQEAMAAQIASQTQALLQEISRKVDALIEDPSELQEPLKRLALHLAEQLVLTELTLSPQAIEHLIERCMDTLDASDASAMVVELNTQDLALLQNQQRVDGQPKPAWRLQADHLLLPGSVRVRADDAVVSDLIENRLESLAHSLLNDPQAWQAHSAFSPSKLASRLTAQRGNAQTVEDAQAKPASMKSEPLASAHAETTSAFEQTTLADEAFETDDAFDDAHAPGDEEEHTYEAHQVRKATPPVPEDMTAQFNDTLNDITLELDKLDD